MSESTTPAHEFVRPGQVAPDRPPRDRCMVCGRSAAAHYHDAVTEAENDVAEALSHIAAEVDAGRLSVAEAAHERVGLLTAHLERLHQLRITHLGGEK